MPRTRRAGRPTRAPTSPAAAAATANATGHGQPCVAVSHDAR